MLDENGNEIIEPTEPQTLDEANEQSKAKFDQYMAEAEGLIQEDGAPAPEPVTEPVAEPIEGQPVVAEPPVVEPDQASVQLQQAQDQIQQQQAQIQQLQQQYDQTQQTMQQQSQQAQEQITTPMLERPTLNRQDLIYDDPDTASAKEADYEQKLEEYLIAKSVEKVMSSVAPLTEQLNQTQAQQAQIDMQNKKMQTIENMSREPMFKDIKTMLPQVEQVINTTPELKNMGDVETQLLMAYTMLHGFNSLNAPPVVPTEPQAPTPEDIVAQYNSNPEIRKLIDQTNIDRVKGNQDIPPFIKGSGAGNIAPNLQDEATTLDEAHERAKKRIQNLN